MSGFRIASDTLQWLAVLLAGREYMEGLVDGLHHARLRAQWCTLASKRCCKIRLVGYVDGVRCDHESRLARVRLN